MENKLKPKIYTNTTIDFVWTTTWFISYALAVLLSVIALNIHGHSNDAYIFLSANNSNFDTNMHLKELNRST
jgi:hypothetical protein